MGVTKGGEGADDFVHLYVKAGVDGLRQGACPFCQRIYMVMMIKAQYGLLRFEVIASNPAKPPDELKRIGLKHLPAIIHGDEGFDAEDDIVTYLDEKFPGGGLKYDNQDADIACKDFFSKFCFYIKAVSKDSAQLDHALEKLNAFLESTTPPHSPTHSPPPKSPTSPAPTSPALTAKSLSSLPSTTSQSPTPSLISSTTSPRSASPIQSPVPSSPQPGGKGKGPSVCSFPALLPNTTTSWPVMTSGGNKLSASSGSIISNDSGAESITSEHAEQQQQLWLCGPTLSHLDCEALPKLQHLRVAAASLKQYQVPQHLKGCWRYLHNAYNSPVFAQTCPCDQEIILHWYDRPETKKLSHKKHAEIAKEKPKYSFDVPVRASVVTVVEIE
uniref:Chloride intracellular channel protein 2-like n=1 Tax=Hirondellea gigas TaxID=1518452 RepID=A0A2P2HZ31_9CRUS